MAIHISRSSSLRLVITFAIVGAIVLGFEHVTFDLGSWGGSTAAYYPNSPVPGSRVPFTATAYCKGTTTTSGTEVRTGIAAADPQLLPVGSVVNITTDSERYNGVYTVMDTGPSVQGRTLDLYMWSCKEALSFGRKDVQVTILRLGWNPGASTPSLVDRLFRRREASRQPPTTVATPPVAPPPATLPGPDEPTPAPTATDPASPQADASPAIQ